jgi:hypothetical protein
MRVQYRAEQWPTLHPFRITGRTWTTVEVLVVELETDGLVGRGEAFGNDVKGETLQTIAAQVRDVVPALRGGASRQDLIALLPPGGGAQCAGLRPVGPGSAAGPAADLAAGGAGGTSAVDHDLHHRGGRTRGDGPAGARLRSGRSA